MLYNSYDLDKSNKFHANIILQEIKIKFNSFILFHSNILFYFNTLLCPKL